MNALTNKFQESGARHSATDKAAAPSSVPTDGRGGQPSDAPFHVPSEVVICLPMPPTTNNLFVNFGRGRRKSEPYKQWIQLAGYRLNAQRPPLTAGKVTVLIEVEEPKTEREMDLANREKATVDLLVTHSLIGGDSNRYVRELNMRWADIKGVRVTIRPLEAAHEFKAAYP